jgi:hypothetical protein
MSCLERYVRGFFRVPVPPRPSHKYDFGDICISMNTKYFDVPARSVPKQIHPRNDVIFLFGPVKSDVTSKILRPVQRNHLSSKGITPVLESYPTAAWELLEKEVPRRKHTST